MKGKLLPVPSSGSSQSRGRHIWPTHYPEGLDTVTQHLLPELERAGYFTPLPEEPRTFRELFTTHDQADVAVSG